MKTIPCHPAKTIRRRTTGSLFLLLMMLLIFTTGGNARAQEINITQSGFNYFSGDTFDFGDVPVGTPSTRTFTIRNSGTFQLGVSGISKSGTNANNFSNTNVGNGTILSNSTTTFNITFTPSAASTRNATFSIANTDFNENPYIIYVTGTGVAVPNIAITQSGANMAHGSSTVNFGNVNTGITARRTFTIRNAGLATLTNLSLSLSGGSSWSVTSLNETSLASSQSTSITVSFSPAGSFTSNASITIFSNDPDTGSFTIGLTGTGVVPIMSVEQPAGTPLFDGSDTVTIAAPLTGSAQRTFSVKNVSTGLLTGLAVSIDGAAAADFVAGALPAPTLAAGDTMTFTVTFTPLALGDVTAALHIASDQTSADPFDINLTGSGVELPDLGDEDGDGAANMLERAAGTDPLVAGPHPGSLVKNGASLEFTFFRRSSLIGVLDLTVEWSDALSDTWSTLEPGTYGSLAGDDGTLQTILYTFPAGNTGHRFVRLRATRVTP